MEWGTSIAASSAAPAGRLTTPSVPLLLVKVLVVHVRLCRGMRDRLEIPRGRPDDTSNGCFSRSEIRLLAGSSSGNVLLLEGAASELASLFVDPTDTGPTFRGKSGFRCISGASFVLLDSKTCFLRGFPWSGARFVVFVETTGWSWLGPVVQQLVGTPIRDTISTS
jgi:hypothetical protein